MVGARRSIDFSRHGWTVIGLTIVSITAWAAAWNNSEGESPHASKAKSAKATSSRNLNAKVTILRLAVEPLQKWIGLVQCLEWVEPAGSELSPSAAF